MSHCNNTMQQHLTIFQRCNIILYHFVRTIYINMSLAPTRTVGQVQLEKFRTAMTSVIKNPYSVLLKPGKIPFGLITEPDKESRVKILETESYADAFGMQNKYDK